MNKKTFVILLTLVVFVCLTVSLKLMFPILDIKQSSVASLVTCLPLVLLSIILIIAKNK